MKRIVLKRIAVLLLTFLVTGVTASACDLDHVPASARSSQALLLSANQLMAQRRDCAAARILVQVYDEYPMPFALENGFFTLIKLEMDLGLYDKAIELYKTWPWDVKKVESLSPWHYVPVAQQPAVQLMIWKLFARYIPKDTGLCLEDPLTAKCDDGEGLDDYDQTFARRFPSSPLIGKMRTITNLFYTYRMQHEIGLLKESIATYEHAQGPLGSFGSFFSDEEGRRSGYLLASILMQALQIRKMARPRDKARPILILREYAPRLRSLERRYPALSASVIPALAPKKLDHLIAELQRGHRG